MPKIGPEALKEVNAAFARYTKAVESTDLSENSKSTYLGHAEHFVRWLRDDFTPGSRK